MKSIEECIYNTLGNYSPRVLLYIYIYIYFLPMDTFPLPYIAILEN